MRKPRLRGVWSLVQGHTASKCESQPRTHHPLHRHPLAPTWVCLKPELMREGEPQTVAGLFPPGMDRLSRHRKPGRDFPSTRPGHTPRHLSPLHVLWSQGWGPRGPPGPTSVRLTPAAWTLKRHAQGASSPALLTAKGVFQSLQPQQSPLGGPPGSQSSGSQPEGSHCQPFPPSTPFPSSQGRLWGGGGGVQAQGELPSPRGVRGVQAC